MAGLVGLASVRLLQQGFALREPATEAQAITEAIAGLVDAYEADPALGIVLSEAQAGRLQLSTGPMESVRGPFAVPATFLRADVRGSDYLAVVGADGRIVASSDAGRLSAGSPLQVPAGGGAAEVLRRALVGERDTARLSARVGIGGFGAFPIIQRAGDAPIGAVVVAERQLPPSDAGRLLVRAVAVFGLFTTLALLSSSVFSLLFSGLAAFILARRFGRRLEALSEAADGLARGELHRRVAEGRPDEIGLLGRHFNEMAERLEQSIGELANEKARAETALLTRRDLVANVSHELRTPLALIRAQLESLQLDGRLAKPEAVWLVSSALQGEPSIPGEPIPDDQLVSQVGALGLIQREAVRLEQLIDDLFALASAEAGGLPLSVEGLELASIAQEVVGELGPIARRERQVLLVNSIGEEVPSVRADRQRLGQVLTNLLRNAIRYTPEGRLVSLSAETRPLEVEVSVADTGPGIAPEAMSWIFERSCRADPARDRTSGGVGLGLAIVRELIEAMGGRVGVESVEDRGGRFWFTLARD